MSQRSTRRPARTRVAAALAVAPALALIFQTSSASAAPASASATPASSQEPGPGSVCGPHPEYGGFFCDLNDIAGLLSDAINPALAATCLDPDENVVICRVNDDNTPFDD